MSNKVARKYCLECEDQNGNEIGEVRIDFSNLEIPDNKVGEIINALYHMDMDKLGKLFSEVEFVGV